MNAIAPAVYLIGFLVTLACGVFLFRAWSSVGKRLLLWSAVCFCGLAISNLLVFVDLVLLPSIDLYPLRLLTAAASMLILLYGLIWEGQQ